MVHADNGLGALGVASLVRALSMMMQMTSLDLGGAHVRRQQLSSALSLSIVPNTQRLADVCGGLPFEGSSRMQAMRSDRTGRRCLRRASQR